MAESVEKIFHLSEQVVYIMHSLIPSSVTELKLLVLLSTCFVYLSYNIFSTAQVKLSTASISLIFLLAEHGEFMSAVEGVVVS